MGERTTPADRPDLVSLISRDTPLRPVSDHHGGEWVGPCPLCGGIDTLRVWPLHPSGTGRWKCEACGKGGDAVQYVVEQEGVSRWIAHTILDENRDRRLSVHRAPQWEGSPVRTPPSWQEEAWALVDRAERFLWDDPGRGARKWLLQVWNLTEDLLKEARVGFVPREIRSVWHGVRVVVPRGILFPWIAGDTIWALRVWVIERIPPRFQTVRGSVQSVLFLPRYPLPDRPVFILEREIEALKVQEIAGDRAFAMATGSLAGGRAWATMFRPFPRVFVSFAERFKTAALWWMEVHPRSVLWPYPSDSLMHPPNEDVLVDWVNRALETLGDRGVIPTPVLPVWKLKGAEEFALKCSTPACWGTMVGREDPGRPGWVLLRCPVCGAEAWARKEELVRVLRLG